MKAKACFVGLLMASGVSSVALGSGLISGHYVGGGNWKDDRGNSGRYTVETTVSDDQIASSYRFDGVAKQWDMNLTNLADGFFDISSGGATVGRGYCFDVQCHYSALDSLEETFSFVDGNLYKLGSKRGPSGETIVWQEELRLE